MWLCDLLMEEEERREEEEVMENCGNRSQDIHRSHTKKLGKLPLQFDCAPAPKRQKEDKIRMGEEMGQRERKRA